MKLCEKCFLRRGFFLKKSGWGFGRGFEWIMNIIMTIHRRGNHVSIERGRFSIFSVFIFCGDI